jgi:hypothetical protein
MAWAERTIHEVSDPAPDHGTGEEDRINRILKNMPPFIKLSSRRARKTLAKYEEVKQRHIENLRNNAVFKFVMMVAGFTNENMQKYWKGSDASPFQEGYGPKDVKIDKEEIELLVRRARERAFADLHQFCRPIVAIPMYRRQIQVNGRRVFGTRAQIPDSADNVGLGGSARGGGPTSPVRINRPTKTRGPTPRNGRQARRNIFSSPDAGSLASAETESPTAAGGENIRTPQQPIRSGQTGAITDGDVLPRGNPVTGGNRGGLASDGTSRKKYIYNMSDMEFKSFCRFFVNEGLSQDRVFNDDGDNKVERYVLGDHDADPRDRNFPADKHQRANNNQRVDRLRPADEAGQPGEVQYNANRIAREGQGRDRVFDEARIFDENWTQVDSYDHRDPFVSVGRTNWREWAGAQPLIQWGSNFTQFWFQRYIARWLVMDEGYNRFEGRYGQEHPYTIYTDLEEFQNKYATLFNNLFLKGPERREWMRDLTGLRLTKMIRPPRFNNRGNPVFNAEGNEGDMDGFLPCDSPCEVPLDFVKPLFNERFAYWKHELVLGEYEKRTMYEADQWLQKTPWAIGKIYLQPNIYSHMQEAHIAISTRFKKFNGLSLQDWLSSEKHMFFYAKLVALCIRTSAVLSNKKYGLDKAYMRLNLEKRRVMYSLGKMAKPERMPVARMFPRASANQERLWEEYRAARARGDRNAAGAALQGLI